jgi:hypothetical protein
MNKHVMALAVCLALQPMVALGAETMTAERRPQYSNPSAEAQRNLELPYSGQRGSGCKQGDVAKNCITFRPVNPNGVASQEANRPDGTQLVHTFPDGERLYAVTNKSGIQKLSAIDQRGRALKVEIVQNPPKDLLIGPNDAIERGNKQRAAEGGGRRQATFSDVDDPTLVKKCIVKILAPSSLLGPNDKLLGPNNLIGPNNSLYWDLAASGMGCPKG